MDDMPTEHNHTACFILLATIVKGLSENKEGHFILSLSDNGEWLASLEFGKEADDSPMTGGASYGRGPTAMAAILGALADTNWLVFPNVGG